MTLKASILAFAAANFGLGHVERPKTVYENHIDNSKYAPRAKNRGKPGDKLRRKAREGKLGIAVLK